METQQLEHNPEVNEKTVFLIPVEGEEKKVKVKYNVACTSKVLRNMLEDMFTGNEKDGEEPMLPVPGVSEATLIKTIEFFEHHLYDQVEEDPPTIKKTLVLSEWDKAFCNVGQDELFHLILAANFLDHKLMLDVTTKTVANMIAGKTPEEIRAHFHIVNDFTPEEEEQIKKENSWCEE